MDLKELDSFKMSDAIAFHDQLNPKLFHGQQLRPDVDEQLKVIAQDFLSELGVKDLDVKDITISGSNAAFSYTPNSDLDLHILVDLSQYSDDAVYQELFHAKKNLYNESHDITINGIPVELYVQDASEPVVSLGEYSILKNKWIRIPSKRRSNLDQTATKQKYEKLAKIAEYALHSKDLSKVKNVLDTIKRYRQAGLDVGGEFGPENLAYKMLRSQGVITKLYALRDKLHSQRLSIEGMYSVEEDNEQMYRTTPTVEQLVIKYKVPKRDILIQLDKGIKIELKHNKDRDVARKIVLNHLRDDPHYYNNIDEDYDPNGPPPGPEFKPTMPAGTVKVDVSDTYDWYKLGQHISNMKGLGKHDFGQGPPSTILSFGDENTEHKYINDLEKTGLTTTDIDPFDPNQPKGMKRQKTDPTYNVSEGFDQPYPITWEKSEYGDVDALAKLPDGKPLAIMFNRIHNDDGEETIQVRFFRNNTDEISGEGDAQRVFATVLTAIQQYIKEYKPARINFSAKKEKEEEDENGKKKPVISRAKLYDRMVQRYAKAWGYRSFRADNGDIVIYELNRINKVSEASGYIPSEKQKNDPRFSTALTVDVKPDSIKKNAKAFAWLTNRAGVPPTAKANGKIS